MSASASASGDGKFIKTSDNRWPDTQAFDAQNGRKNIQFPSCSQLTPTFLLHLHLQRRRTMHHS